VPNASAMVIMDADRFGVSQLHQLRGRVGRGGLPGLCLLVTEAREGSQARRRLDAVAATLDGFELSRVDLEQRREGDVLGVAQSGRKSSLKLLRLLEDEDLIETAHAEAAALLGADPDLAAHPALRSELDALRAGDGALFLGKALHPGRAVGRCARWPAGYPTRAQPWDGLPPNAVPGWAHPRVRCRGSRRAEGLTTTSAGLPLGHVEGRRI